MPRGHTRAVGMIAMMIVLGSLFEWVGWGWDRVFLLVLLPLVAVIAWFLYRLFYEIVNIEG